MTDVAPHDLFISTMRAACLRLVVKPQGKTCTYSECACGNRGYVDMWNAGVEAAALWIEQDRGATPDQRIYGASKIRALKERSNG